MDLISIVALFIWRHTMTYEIEIICSYCGARIGTKLSSESNFLTEMKAINGDLVSHSICRSCFRYAIADILDYKSEAEDN